MAKTADSSRVKVAAVFERDENHQLLRATTIRITTAIPNPPRTFVPVFVLANIVFSR
jgi:hypothetical protein